MPIGIASPARRPYPTRHPIDPGDSPPALFREADAEKPQTQGLTDEGLRGRGGSRQHQGALADLLRGEWGAAKLCSGRAAAFFSRGAGQTISAPR